jgi:DNA-binding transcriptional ArsR family regulator
MTSKADNASPEQTRGKDRAKSIIDPRLVKALAHPIRNDALSILNERVASPNEIANELGEHVGHVSYHIKVLKDCDCIELVSTAPRRGAVEHYYRATSRAFFDLPEWETLPLTVRAGLSASLMETLFNDTSAALKEETFDRRTDRHFSWTPMLVDEQGWGEARDELAALLDRIFEIQAKSGARLTESEEEGIPLSVAMLSFEAATAERHRIAPKDAQEA